VQYWIAFELVKIYTKYGLTPIFNENLKDWSLDLHCIVQLLSKTTQTKEDKERATKCIDTLFNKDRTENWGHFGQTEFGTKSHLQKMSNFGFPLVILTWQRMLLKHFHDNSDETFFELGNYSARGKKYAAAPFDNLCLIKRDTIKEGQETHFFSFDCFRSRRNHLFFNGQIISSNKMQVWRLPVRKKQDLEHLK
jgi:hypothetical protein